MLSTTGFDNSQLSINLGQTPTVLDSTNMVTVEETHNSARLEPVIMSKTSLLNMPKTARVVN